MCQTTLVQNIYKANMDRTIRKIDKFTTVVGNFTVLSEICKKKDLNKTINKLDPMNT